jgi:uridine kinase
MENLPVTVIGIMGPSGSGKSTAARNLAKYYSKLYNLQRKEQYPVIHGDMYFCGEKAPFTPSGWRFASKFCPFVSFTLCLPLCLLPSFILPHFQRNVEVPEAINWEKQAEAIQEAKKKLVSDPTGPKSLLVEGFLLFCDPDTVNFFDYMIFLEAAKETCYERRKARKQRKDLERFNLYYEEYVWPCHVECRKKFVDPLENVLYLNTDDLSEQEIVEKILNYVSKI